MSRENANEAGLIFADFMKRWPDSVFVPQVELAIARTYELRSDWTNALKQYDSWLLQFTNHEARPRAEYFRASALSQMGNQTNALIGFTNFVAHFPTNDLAPMAYLWIADYYYNIGAYAASEEAYNFIANTWPKSELAFQARLMAGRAAVGRTSWENASQFYFTPLWTNPASPPDVKFQALFDLANATIIKDSTNKVDDYREAIKEFTLVANEKTNALSVLAWGQIAICYLQWAQMPGENSGQLTNALVYFQRIIDEPAADVAARSIAKVGLGGRPQKTGRPGQRASPG